MDSEKKRSDEYWMGVRDALRMVDSFNKWAKRNQERAKDLDDFIHDGLIAAAKRCESCLKDELGLTFSESGKSPTTESVPSGYRATPPFPELDESMAMSESIEEVLSPDDDEDISIESVGRSEGEEMEDISLDGPPRDFTSDFDLVEPSPLIMEPSHEEDESDIDAPTEKPPEERKPSFTWADYEEAVSPTKSKPEEEEPSPLDSSTDEEMFPPSDAPITLGAPKILTPSEEPSLPTDELERSVDDELSEDIDSDYEEPDKPEPITEPPAPPPPESDEDEEERRRRARRLFFGD
ncbi:MAG: hypothetical protein ACFFCP_09575 [Promethearchaeota archaeon]